jgi:hypothetical protein
VKKGLRRPRRQIFTLADAGGGQPNVGGDTAHKFNVVEAQGRRVESMLRRARRLKRTGVNGMPILKDAQ